MGLKKLLEKLGDVISDGIDSDGHTCKDLRQLLTKLEKKQAKLEKELAETKGTSKRKKIKLELKIVKAELKKGNKLAEKECG